MIGLKVLLGVAACASVAIAFSITAFIIGFGGGDDVTRVAFFAALTIAGSAGIVGLFFRGPWGAVVIVVQAIALFLFWLIPGGGSSAGWMIPGVPIATALLGTFAIWKLRRTARPSAPD